MATRAGVALLAAVLAFVHGCERKADQPSKVVVNSLPDGLRNAIARTFRVEPQDLNDFDLAGVTTVHLENARDEDLRALGVVPNLWDLYISSTSIRTFASVPRLPQLRFLVIADAPIESLQGIEQLTDLEELDLTRTRVRDLTPLRSLRNLRKLRIVQTPVESVTAIADLPRLELLALVGTAVKDVAPLQDLQRRCNVYVQN